MTHQKQGNNELHFFYDSKSSIIGFTLNGGAYTYLKNLQGDVIGIVDGNGNKLAEYSYDSWGNIISQSGPLSYINPIRYKGYYYDSDTGMYYLQSRYYDPALRRFINADEPNLIQGLAKTSVIGSNLFSYCGNNGVNRVDYNGNDIYSDFWQYVNGLPITKKATKWAGFTWDKSQQIWYSNMNPIQRKFGYCDLYDTLAPLAGIFIKHKKMPFNYNGKEWMIWLWKGQYGITVGGEIGLYIYSKTIKVQALFIKYSLRWYRCANDNERIKMAFTLYKNGRKYFERPFQLHWWLTGFKVGNLRRNDELSMRIELGFSNERMANAFCKRYKLKKKTSTKVIFWW